MASHSNSNYLSIALKELLIEDGLTVMGRGLGLHSLVSKFLDIYNDRKRLVFCLNASNSDVTTTCSVFSCDILLNQMIVSSKYHFEILLCKQTLS